MRKSLLLFGHKNGNNNLNVFIIKVIIMFNYLTSIMALGTTITILFWIVIVWSIIWKGIALWKCGRKNQLVWFIFILIFNTAGILPIIYLLFFQKKEKQKRKSASRINL